MTALNALLSGMVTGATAYHPSIAKSTRDRVDDVLNQPFADLNLSRQQVPAILNRAATAPFLQPADCDGFEREIALLTGVFGLTFSSRTQPATASRGNDAQTQAWNAARSATGGLIPLRGVVRWLSGAELQDHRVQQALLSGYVRRACLQGVRDAKPCGAGPFTAVTQIPVAPHGT